MHIARHRSMAHLRERPFPPLWWTPGCEHAEHSSSAMSRQHAATAAEGFSAGTDAELSCPRCAGCLANFPPCAPCAVCGFFPKMRCKKLPSLLLLLLSLAFCCSVFCGSAPACSRGCRLRSQSALAALVCACTCQDMSCMCMCNKRSAWHRKARMSFGWYLRCTSCAQAPKRTGKTPQTGALHPPKLAVR